MSILKNKNMQAVKVYEPVVGIKHIVMESDRLEDCIALAAEHKSEISGVTISRHKGYTDETLDFLKDMPWLKRVMICDEYRDVSAISFLRNLEYLQLSSAPLIDFSALVKLKEYSGDWPENNDSFYTLKEISSLWLWNGSKQGKLSQLGVFTKLKSLEMTELSLSTLDGIENIPLLEALEFHFCRKITSIESVAKLSKLTRIKFENCKKIDSFSVLSNNSNLETVSLAHCGEIDNIDFVSVLPALKGLFFFGTVVKNNDLSPILKCGELKSLGFNDKKTYSHKCNELKKALGILQ